MYKSNPLFSTEALIFKGKDSFPIYFSDSSDDEAGDDLPKTSLFTRNWVNAEMYQQFQGSLYVSQVSSPPNYKP